jgi:hypothetical protein
MGRHERGRISGQARVKTVAKKSVIEKFIEFDTVRVIFSVRQLGYTDYDVLGHPQGIYRIKILPDLKIGDIFNAYSGESTKNGVVWLGSIEKSLHDTCLNSDIKQ